MYVIQIRIIKNNYKIYYVKKRLKKVLNNTTVLK